MQNHKPLLSIKNLSLDFATEQGRVRALDNIGFDVYPGETIGLVGESGCGKSVTSMSILGLVPQPPGHYSPESQILFQDRQILGLPESELQNIRGSEISMIFQEPMTALNPVYPIGRQITDVICRHDGVSRRQAQQRAVEMLDLVGIPEPLKRLKDYPHQLSGGMRQRVMIGMALACHPKLLLADEPTTALDVTIQAQVLEQMAVLQRQRGMAMLLVTHDLGVIAGFCSRVVVMYCGKVVEVATVDELFHRPQHPYTRGLLDSIPRLRDKPIERLPTIPGTVPDLKDVGVGCRFVERCQRQKAQCKSQEPPVVHVTQDASVACFNPLS